MIPDDSQARRLAELEAENKRLVSILDGIGREMKIAPPYDYALLGEAAIADVRRAESAEQAVVAIRDGITRIVETWTISADNCRRQGRDAEALLLKETAAVLSEVLASSGARVSTVLTPILMWFGVQP